MPFNQASAYAQSKTGFTVTFFEDPTAVEYAVMLALIIVVCITAIDNANVAPTLNNQACTIQSKVVAGLTAIGIVVPPGACAIQPPSLTIPQITLPCAYLYQK